MAQQTPISAIGNAPSTTNGTTAFLPLSSGIPNTWDTTETDSQQVIPCAGTIDYLLIHAVNSVSGYTFTVRKNGVDTTLTAALSSSNTANDKVHSFTVAAGDLVCIKCVTGAGATTAGFVSWNVRFTASSANQSIMLGGLFGTKSATTRYCGLQGAMNLVVTTESLAEQIMPCAGTLNNFYTSLTNAQVADVITVTVFKNGIASTILTTYSLTSATQANDTTHSISVVAGDRVSVQLAFTTGTGTSNVLFGIEFDPTVDGQSVGMCNAASTVANNATRFGAPIGGGESIIVTETQAQGVIMACTVQDMYAAIPGGGTISAGSMVSTLRKNATNQILLTTITSNNANDTTDTVSTADGDLLSVGTLNNATGAATAIAFGVVFFISDAIIPIWAAQMYGDEQVRGTLQEAIPY